MSYISEIFERLNLQHIREFLLNGVECLNISDKPYEQKLSDADDLITERIQQHFPDRNDSEQIISEVYNYASVTQNVYMEIGIQCGLALSKQLIPPTKKVSSDRMR